MAVDCMGDWTNEEYFKNKTAHPLNNVTGKTFLFRLTGKQVCDVTLGTPPKILFISISQSLQSQRCNLFLLFVSFCSDFTRSVDFQSQFQPRKDFGYGKSSRSIHVYIYYLRPIPISWNVSWS